MYNPVRNWILTLFKVPPEPHPPAGNPASLRVFRAGKNYFRLKLFGWGIGQLLALAGIVFWVVVLIDVEAEASRRIQLEPDRAPLTKEAFRKSIESFANEAVPKEGASGKRRVRIAGYTALKRALVEVAMQLPVWAFPLLWLLKAIGIVAYLAQIPFTYFLRRLDYEMRWYIVTDRSLRLRSGVAKVKETTMSFANLQQVEMTQNPIQRLLGLGDVRVQSAGGGSGGKHEKHEDDSMHRARFHAVDNAPEIRDLILERLRRFRQAGLGDPDDHEQMDEAPHPAGSALEAAREVLAEARALRSIS